MSLDDIIKSSSEFKRGRGRRGGRGGTIRRGGTSRVNARGGVGPIRNRRGRFNTPRSTYTRVG